MTPILKFQLDSVEVRIHGVRQDDPPKMRSITYEIAVATKEPDRRLELLHQNVRRYGTVFNTLVPGTELSGTLRRARERNPECRISKSSSAIPYAPPSARTAAR